MIDVREGDCLEVMRGLVADGVRVQSIVTDPPYHLASIVKRFGKADSAPAQFGIDGAYTRASRGFMGKQWDGGDIAFRPEVWRLCFDLLPPGGHLLAFGGTRTYHRMACAIEDAGFEIRDQIGWLYGSGFPKSHDVSKGIDRAAGVEREVIAAGAPVKRMIPGADQNKQGWEKNSGREYQPGERPPVTDAARQWKGWGTALKPAWEPIVLARKPIDGTVAGNVQTHGAGALNINACRVDATDNTTKAWRGAGDRSREDYRTGTSGKPIASDLGRWPANVIHDGSEEVLAAFPDAPGQQQADVSLDAPSAKTGNIYGKMNRHGEKSRDARYQDKGSTDFAALPGMRRMDGGSAARFFYSSKADAEDRLGSKHPTVKPVDLMAYLVRLVTPPGGIVLDPFAGSGSTGMACMREGFNAILIEREPEYIADIRRRLAHVDGADTPLFEKAAK